MPQKMKIAMLITLLMSAAVELAAQGSPVAPSVEAKPLSGVKRIYVDSLGDQPVAQQVQSMLIATLVRTGRFVITENRDSADAVLKGMASEISSKDYRSQSDSTAVSSGGSSFGGSATGNTASASGSEGHISAAQSNSSAYTQTTYIARLSIRLVNASGDVLWATTQESTEPRNQPISSALAVNATRVLLRDVDGKPGTNSNPDEVLRSARKIVVTVKGDQAMETEIAQKILGWGKLTIVPSLTEADLSLEVTQTGKYDGLRGTGVTAAAELKSAEQGAVLWTTTKGGSWSMSGYSTRKVARQIADDLIKFIDENRKSK